MKRLLISTLAAFSSPPPPCADRRKARFNRRLRMLTALLKILALLLFVLSLFIECLNGDTHGFLANSHPFRGYWLLLFGFFLPLSAGLYGLPWITVAAANILIVVATLWPNPHFARGPGLTTVLIAWCLVSALAPFVVGFTWEGLLAGFWLWSASVLFAVSLTALGLFTPAEQPRLLIK